MRPTRSLALAFGVATMLMVGCSSQVAPPSSPPSAITTSAHIHELVVDTADGTLLLATHEGLYRLSVGDNGSAAVIGPIGGFDFDPMGFTLADGVAYASGHPGPTTPDTFGSPNLGLITSTDAGKTWTNVSLTGETDFHGLTVATSADADPRVFGYDAARQRIMISLDGGTSWSDGAELAARDILTTGDKLYATTADGLAVSSDNGKTFTIDPAAPALYLIAADQAGTIAGVDTSGVLWARETDGEWTEGLPVEGIPQAFAIDGARLYVADDRGIAYTEDAGATWVVLQVSPS